MNRYAIDVRQLTKVFYKREKEKGLHRIFGRRAPVYPVKGLSFKVRKGEILGYLGENGSGKTTTVKLLTGILTPTSGSVTVLGHVPWKREKEYLKRIGVVFGRQSLLFWDIPAWDAFIFYRDVYGVPDDKFRDRIEYFESSLGIKKLVSKPVRKMSLGEQMKCNLAAALLHFPEIVFLDEPTIGLDAVSKEAVRDFLLELNKHEKTTVLLTTHDVLDVEALCRRVILLDKGRKIYDGSLSSLKKEYMGYKTLYVEYSEVKNRGLFNRIIRSVNVTGSGEGWIEMELAADGTVAKAVSALLKAVDVSDLDLKEPGLDKLLVKIYGRKKG